MKPIEVFLARVEGAAIGDLIGASVELDAAYAAIGTSGADYVDREELRNGFYMALGRRSAAYRSLDLIRREIQAFQLAEQDRRYRTSKPSGRMT